MPLDRRDPPVVPRLVAHAAGRRWPLGEGGHRAAAASGAVAGAGAWQHLPGGVASGGQGSVEGPINDSKGCGGVMRTAPLGFLGDGFVETDVYTQGVAAAALTHGHPDG